MSDRTFALIVGGVVRDVAVAAGAEVLERAGVRVVDVTAESPVPSVGWSYADGVFSAPPPFALGEVLAKRRAIDAVNAAAGRARAKYLTVCEGQAETYLLKADELRAYDAAVDMNEEIVPAHYPILSAEAAATGATLDATAALVRATRAAWVQLAAAIEGQRRGAIVAIQSAAHDDAITAAIPTTWP